MMFGTLIKRRPELESELQTFKDFLLSSQSFEEPLKVWEMKDLGAQAAARVAGASNSLRMLREVSGNFPSLAKSLTKVGVNESFKFELESNTQVLQGMGYGGNVFAVARQGCGGRSAAARQRESVLSPKRSVHAVHPARGW